MSLELDIPAGMHVMQVATADGFTFDVKKDGDRIVSITWKREIKPKEFARFTFTAHNPAAGRAAVESASDVRRRLDAALGRRARLEGAGFGDDDRAERRSDESGSGGRRAQTSITR